VLFEMLTAKYMAALGRERIVPSRKQTEQTFDVEGHVVRCIEIDGDRLWHCGCAAFQERLSRLHEGFCGHTVVAIVSLQEELES
jgi:hypothetical protein